MFFWDPTFILLIPALILAAWAQGKLSRTYARYSKERSARGITGAQAARRILDSSGLSAVNIERVAGNLTDHYDPRSKVLRLSEGVFGSDSIAAVGIAAHEVGHAIQHKNAYAPLSIRNAFVPVVNFGSFMAWPLFYPWFSPADTIAYSAWDSVFLRRGAFSADNPARRVRRFAKSARADLRGRLPYCRGGLRRKARPQRGRADLCRRRRDGYPSASADDSPVEAKIVCKLLYDN